MRTLINMISMISTISMIRMIRRIKMIWRFAFRVAIGCYSKVEGKTGRRGKGNSGLADTARRSFPGRCRTRFVDGTSAALVCLMLLAILTKPMPLAAFELDQDFLALCYHDVRDVVKAHYDPDEMAVSTRNLIAHFAWLKENGYTPITLDELIAANNGTKPLPPKPIMITFDDGLKSIYTRIYPVLKMFNYPAVVAIVPSWIESKEELNLAYGLRKLQTEDFMTWDQIRELDRTGLIEFASHSFDLHHGVLANPQSNMQPAATARIYDPKTRTYESDEDYKKRIREDLTDCVSAFETNLGKKPRMIVWPYGQYNDITMAIAKSLGMGISLTIASDANRLADISKVHRLLITRNMDVNTFDWWLHHPLDADPENEPQRMVRIKMDHLYSINEFEQNRNLDNLLERVKGLHVNIVIIQAYSDSNGDGIADSAYFPNRHLPVKADLFNRVAWQLRTRSEVKTIAWLPVTGFNLSRSLDGKHGKKNLGPGKGVSLFDPDARKVIAEIYEDLGRYTDIDGILFDTDADYRRIDDFSPSAREHYKKHWGMVPGESLKTTPTTAPTAGNPKKATHKGNDKRNAKGKKAGRRTVQLLQDSRELAVKKAAYMYAFCDHLKTRVQIGRGCLLTFSFVYPDRLMRHGGIQGAPGAPPIDPVYKYFSDHFDYTVVLAAPPDEMGTMLTLPSKKWLHRLVRLARATDHNLNKTIFELQAAFPSGKKVKTETILFHAEELQLEGGINVGYFPEDFVNMHPDLEKLRLGISLRDYPYKKK